MTTASRKEKARIVREIGTEIGALVQRAKLLLQHEPEAEDAAAWMSEIRHALYRDESLFRLGPTTTLDETAASLELADEE